MKVLSVFYFFFLIAVLGGSCNKSDYLAAKPNSSLVIPSTLEDYQRILDNDRVMNGANWDGLFPTLGELGADDYYIPDFVLSSGSEATRRIYVWRDDIYDESDLLEWPAAYRSVFYANNVLDGIKNLRPHSESEERSYNNIKGSALFYRAHVFYLLAQVYAPPYTSGTANESLGLPLRLTSDINEPIFRSKLSETYEKILTDLKEASVLLPDLPKYKTRPSRAATFALLARTYLIMGNYDSSAQYAGRALAIQNQLLDFNRLDPASTAPIAQFNEEVIFQGRLITDALSALTNQYASRVDSFLYASYADGDLRKGIFFREAAYFGIPDDKGFHFKGSYDGSEFLFCGLSTSELYLTRAECYARKGDVDKALADINTLLTKRWKTGTYSPIILTRKEEVKTKVLEERRKELCFRGLRWADLRRLNAEGANILVKRKIEGVEYTLTPNSLLYTRLLPPSVIGFHSEMQQNKR